MDQQNKRADKGNFKESHIDVSTTYSNESLNYKKNVLGSPSTLSFLGLCVQSLGGIYGDLGTSPLYTYSSIFTSTPSQKDILGATSCIFWSFTIIVLVKYCFIVFTIGSNQGQGGAVAVYAKLAAKLNIAPRGVEIPNWSEKLDEEDAMMLRVTETHNSFIEGHKNTIDAAFLKKYFAWVPLFLTFISTGLIMADGLLTPATSILSAIGGIAVPAPDFTNKVVVVSCIILGLLFLTQRFGSAVISFTFGPIIFIWITSLIIIGSYNVNSYPGIFRSLSPKYAVDYLHEQGVNSLGAVILALTGTECMFADLGHYSVWSVRLTMIIFCYPGLMLCYLGQAARMMENPELYTNAFYRTIPGSGPDGSSGGAIFWVVFVLSTLATIIACQATIFGVSSMFMQLENIDSLPKLHVIHTSKSHFGKIYIPFVNYAMGILVILTTIGYQNSDAVTNAYGLCVAMTFFFTTCLISMTMYACFDYHILICLTFFVLFGAFDMCFVVSGLRKIRHGAWFPLMVAIIIIAFMVFWRWGRSLKVDMEFNSRMPLEKIVSRHAAEEKSAVVLDLKKNRHTTVTSDVVDIGASTSLSLAGRPGERAPLYLTGTVEKVAQLPGIAVFHANAYYTVNSPNTVPRIFYNFLQDFPALHESLVFLATRVINTPFVPFERRVTIIPMDHAPGFYRAIVKFGFMDPIVFDEPLMRELNFQIQQYSGPVSFDPNSHMRTPVHIFTYEAIDSKRASREDGVIRRSIGFVRDVLLNYAFEPIESICRPEESKDHVVQTEEFPQGVFKLTKTVEI